MHSRHEREFLTTMIFMKRLVALCLFLFSHISASFAGHTRVYACILGDDTPENFMGASSLGSGLWTSDDTGRTWKQLGWKHGKCYSVDVYKKSNGKLIFLAKGDGLQRSTDGGKTWKVVTNWRQTEVMDVAIDQNDPSFLFIATATGMWRSNDSGSTFTPDTLGLTVPFISCVKINPLFGNRIAAATERGVFISNDHGESWRQFRPDTNAVRSLHYTSGGRLLWAEEDGSVKGERMIDVNKDFMDRLWTMEEYQNVIFAGGSKGLFKLTVINKEDKVSSERVEEEIISYPIAPSNIHTLVRAGDVLLIGSLDNGLWSLDLRANGAAPKQIYFRHGQVWTLRTFEVD